jgi:hypothetical protein
MAISQSVLQRSQLGRLLVARKLIAEEQLEVAVRLQQTTGKRLGEVLVEQGWVTEKQIARALRKQTNIRLVALVVATLMMPFQMARATDIPTSGAGPYSATQNALISNFETQTTQIGNVGIAGNPGNLDPGNVATVFQSDFEANLASTLQAGSHDFARIEQSGGFQNTAFINQTGANQVAMIVQSGGSHNTAMINQSGSNNSALITQR